MADARERFLWIGPDAARALARRIAIAGDRLARVEGRPHPEHPETGIVWSVVLKGDDGLAAASGEAPLNDTWWCPPICGGGG